MPRKGATRGSAGSRSSSLDVVGVLCRDRTGVPPPTSEAIPERLVEATAGGTSEGQHRLRYWTRRRSRFRGNAFRNAMPHPLQEATPHSLREARPVPNPGVNAASTPGRNSASDPGVNAASTPAGNAGATRGRSATRREPLRGRPMEASIAEPHQCGFPLAGSGLRPASSPGTARTSRRRMAPNHHRRAGRSAPAVAGLSWDSHAALAVVQASTNVRSEPKKRDTSGVGPPKRT